MFEGSSEPNNPLDCKNQPTPVSKFLLISMISISIAVARKARAILRVVMRRLPPRLGGVVYSFTFLLGGLLWVSGKAVQELFMFLTGHIPQSKLCWPIAGDPRSHVRPVVMCRNSFLEVFDRFADNMH